MTSTTWSALRADLFLFMGYEDGGTPPLKDSPNDEAQRCWSLYSDAQGKLRVRDERIAELEGHLTRCEESNSKLTKHNKRLLEQNASIAGLYKEACEEDGEAIDLGMNATEEAKKLEKQVTEIAEVLQTTPERKKILEKINDLMSNQVEGASNFFSGFLKKGGQNESVSK